MRVARSDFNIKNARGGCFAYTPSCPPVTPVLLFNFPLTLCSVSFVCFSKNFTILAGKYAFYMEL